MGFFPTQGQGGLGIPDSPWSFLDDEIRPDWNKPIRKGLSTLGASAIRAIVAAAAAMGAMETYRQVVGDASPSVDDLVADIMDWLTWKRAEQAYGRSQRPGGERRAVPAFVRDGEAHEDAVLRALDELEKPPEYPDPGQQFGEPLGPVQPTENGGRRSFAGWLERKYSRRSVVRYHRSNYYG